MPGTARLTTSGNGIGFALIESRHRGGDFLFSDPQQARAEFAAQAVEQGDLVARSQAQHVADMIELILFTSPGERVNRPTFGCGLMQLIFAPNSDTLAAATQLTVQAALQEWLGNLIQVEGVEVNAQESSLSVLVQYVIIRTQSRQLSQFTR